MGLWYGAEIITHHESEAYETVYDSCVVVHLADVNEVSIVANSPINQSITDAIATDKICLVFEAISIVVTAQHGVNFDDLA